MEIADPMARPLHEIVGLTPRYGDGIEMLALVHQSDQEGEIEWAAIAAAMKHGGASGSIVP